MPSPSVTIDEPSALFSENVFEMAVRSVMAAAVRPTDLKWTPPWFGLDISAQIFKEISGHQRHIEVETKLYKGQRRGGVGFGAKKGGPQVDILLLDPSQQPVLDEQVRWAIADATQPTGAPRFALLTCSEARNAAMGIVARDKQNNFKMSVVKFHATTWTKFCENLSAFTVGA